MSQKDIRIVCLTGMPGSGKNETGNHLASALGVHHAVMSELLNGGESNGTNSPDALALDVFQKHLGGCLNFSEEEVGDQRRRQTQKVSLDEMPPVIYNGLPRTQKQVAGVCDTLREAGLLEHTAFVFLDLNDKESMGRMMKRYNENFGNGELRHDEPQTHTEAHDRFRFRQVVFRTNLPGIKLELAKQGIEAIHIDARPEPSVVASAFAKSLGWDTNLVRQWFAFDQALEAATIHENRPAELSLPLLGDTQHPTRPAAVAASA